MSSHLVNVRLDSDRVRKVRTLRQCGIKLSDLVREAIDARFLRIRNKSRADVKALIRRIFEQYPDPLSLPPRDYDVHDRRAARQAIVGRLRRGR